jgi:hypothetical protein
MATYRVCFDGKWQGDVDDPDEALQWAREVGETGRIVHVAAFGRGPLKRWAISPKLIAVFPRSKAEEGRRLWKERAKWGGWGGTV